jgi:hypothetical protein
VKELPPAHRCPSAAAQLGQRACALAGPGVLALALAGCRSLDRFDTGDDGAFCGNIIDSSFTRRGFEPGLTMRLTLDIDALHDEPGRLSTNDAEGLCAPDPSFADAKLHVTPELFADPLSLLEFGSTRDHNFVAWVDSTCQGSALAVISLMRTGDVEVRLLRRGLTANDETPGDFSVFQLERTDCQF